MRTLVITGLVASVVLTAQPVYSQDQLPPSSPASIGARLRNLSPGARAEVLRYLKELRQPQRLLAVGALFKNPDVSDRPTDWATVACNRSRWLEGADFEWTSVLNPKEGLEDRIVGLSGIVINEHVSADSDSGAGDVWFTHPFGYDWNTNIALDPPYAFLSAPGTPETDDELVQAVKEAQMEGMEGVTNAFHVEFDSGLIPGHYRAQKGDDVAIFGRWIVDCGHTNFTTEVHPPLIYAKARGDDQVDGGTTKATIISRPFFVQQTISGKPLRDHLIANLAKIYSIPADPIIVGPIVAATYQMQARPDISRVPFSGIKWMHLVVRPQYPRTSPLDRLLVRYHLTTRNGVAVQFVGGSEDELEVYILLNDVAYNPATLPPAKNVHHSLSDIKKGLHEIGDLVNKILAGGAFSLNPYGNAILEKGFDTDTYQIPLLVEPPLGSFIPIASIKPPDNPRLIVDDAQPYPIIGTIELKWGRLQADVVRPPTPPPGGDVVRPPIPPPGGDVVRPPTPRPGGDVVRPTR